MKKRSSSNESLSNEFIIAMEMLSGYLTKIKIDHGGIPELIEKQEWNQSQTGYCMKLVSGLAQHLKQIHTEMVEHESGKY